jgi:hypothetical protein
MARSMLFIFISYSLLGSLAQAAREQQEAWPSIADLLGSSPLAPFIPQVCSRRVGGCSPPTLPAPFVL